VMTITFGQDVCIAEMKIGHLYCRGEEVFLVTHSLATLEEETPDIILVRLSDFRTFQPSDMTGEDRYREKAGELRLF
jgi:hypothetical protein